jgi:hypothetical protein
LVNCAGKHFEARRYRALALLLDTGGGRTEIAGLRVGLRCLVDQRGFVIQ